MINLDMFKNMTLLKKICIGLFILFVISLVYCLWNRKNLLMIQNNKEKLAEQFNTDNIKFTMYYVNWCPHCVNTKPHFKKILGDKKINGKNVHITMVDCEKNPELAEQANVESYPTIKFSNNGEEVDYNGERTEQGFMSWLKEKLL